MASLSNSTSPPTRSTNPTPTTIHHLSINQNHTCFSAGLDTGFRVYECDSYKQLMQRDNFGKGIRHVALLFRCNIMCLILDKSNEVMIWDDHRLRCLEKLPCRSEVRNVKLRQDRIVIVLTQRICVYDFMNLRVLHEIDTEVNVKGLCEVSHYKGSMMLVCPGLRKGQVRVEDYLAKKTRFIMAHNSRITCLALTLDGRFMATASTKGTLIRVFNTEDGSLLQEMRRGAERADIYSLAFCSSGQWLAASSDKGTVHVFGLKLDSDSERSVTVPNVYSNSNTVSNVSSLSFFKGVLPRYFSSEWSVAQFRLKEGVQYLVGFGKQKNTIVIIGMDGSYYKCAFDSVNGGEMTRLEYRNFLKPVQPLPA